METKVKDFSDIFDKYVNDGVKSMNKKIYNTLYEFEAGSFYEIKYVSVKGVDEKKIEQGVKILSDKINKMYENGEIHIGFINKCIGIKMYDGNYNIYSYPLSKTIQKC